jgi:DNA-binding winged helix-turn-helix (wHTH) protein/predicted ATPase
VTGGQQVFFPPFTLDISDQLLQHGSEKVFLRPKSLAVLAYLAEHPHRLVSKEELMSAAWLKAKVVDAALRVSIQEIRKALGDESTEPKFIETVGKKGYRFIAPVSLRLPETGGESFLPFVGRDAELNRLQHHLELADSGKRQLVFLTGEPGIGKTTLIEAFLKTLLVGIGMVRAVGLCIEQFGTGEAYLPVLDLLERMCKSASSDTLLESLRQCAPSWLASLPLLVTSAERTELARQSLGTTPERRMRELAIFLEAVSKEQTVVLVLEDLHWVDLSTLALISFLAQRRETARLMLIGTYREDEVERFNHPLKNVKAELQAHNRCSQLPLKLLAQSAVGEYLTARFETDAVPKPLLSTVYGRSEGNPLFMVNMTDYLISREAIAKENGSIKFLPTTGQDPVPETLRGLIERQIAALPRQDQELLEVAAVAGTIFSVAVMARLLNRTRETMEAEYRELSERTHYLQYAGLRIRPKGRGSPRYSFVHALYQKVIYDRIDEARRRRLHQAIGERTENAYPGTTETVAAELAAHFERSGDNERAVKYMLQAAQKSYSVCAYSGTIDYANRALLLVSSLPQSPRRSEIELNLQLLIAVATCASQGYAAEETGRAFARARELSHEVNNDDLLFQSLAGIWSFHLLRGELRTALKQAQDLLALAQRTRKKLFLLNAHAAMALSFFYQGQFQSAHHHLEHALPHYDFEYHRSTISLFSWDPGVLGYCYDAQALWFLGFGERAEKTAGKAVALARQLASPFNEALRYAIQATYYAYRRDAAKAFEMAEAALRISNDRGFLHWIALGSFNKGWSSCILGKVTEGVPLLLDGMKRWKSMGAEMAVPTFRVLLGEIYQTKGEAKKALATVDEGLTIAARNNDRHYDAELYRLKGELLLQISRRNRTSNFKEAEACFVSAIDIAHKQKARSLELRAAMSLACLWQKIGKKREAHRMLAKIYGWFTEGLNTADLKRAKELLDELS